MTLVNFADLLVAGSRQGSWSTEATICLCSMLRLALLAAARPLPPPPPMYWENRRSSDGLFTNMMAWTGGVQVFRDSSNGRLLIHPYEINIISLATPNLQIVKVAMAVAAEETLNRWIRYLLAAATDNRQKVLIISKIPSLYDPSLVAQYFKYWLENRFIGMFRTVLFTFIDTAMHSAFSDIF